MLRLRGRIPPEIAHAAKVALAASLLVGIVYAGCVAVLDMVVTARLTQAVDGRLAERLADVQEVGLGASYGDDDDLDSTPVYLWRETPAGPVAAADSAAPALPTGLRLTPGQATTVRLAAGPFRFAAASATGVTLIAGQSLASEDHLTALLREGETLAAPVLLLAMFGGALTIGLRALLPVEQSRRRQLEFTADASHELRTPLSVISAETSVALSAPRKPAEYRAVLARIEGESSRLRRIVEDLLWLARFDSTPPEPSHEPLDLATIAAACAERFRVLAATRDFDIQVTAGGGSPAWISAPPEWIDRLAGVLIDNACRYAGPSGMVRVSVGQRGNRVTMTVEDSGPGVAAERPVAAVRQVPPLDRARRQRRPRPRDRRLDRAHDRRPVAARRLRPRRRAVRGLLAASDLPAGTGAEPACRPALAGRRCAGRHAADPDGSGRRCGRGRCRRRRGRRGRRGRLRRGRRV